MAHSAEEWRPVPMDPWSRFYDVSTHGRVRSWHNARHGRRTRPRVMKPGDNGVGYPQIHLSAKGEMLHVLVSHLVLEAFVGLRPSGQECRHLDGDPANNYVSNLAWGTPTENAADKVRHGTVNHGVRNGAAKLTPRDVLDIRRSVASSRSTQRALADRYGISPAQVCRIAKRDSWRHV